MKNKKGFTLTELLAVIVILAIIIAIAVPSYMKIKKNIDENNYNNKINLIEIAGQKFAEDTNITAVFVKELVENGYLEADDRDGNIYGLNGEIINCYLVLSERKNGIFYSKFIKEDYSNDKTCDYNIPNELTKSFKIEIYDNDLNHKLTYDDNKKWWTKNDVILKAVFENKEDNEVTWYEGYGEEEIPKCNDKEDSVCVDKNDSKILYIKSGSVLQQNYTAKSTDKDGNPVIARVRVYIDKIVPNFYQNHADKLNNKWSAKTIDYKVNAYDNESGLYGFFDATETTDNCPTTFNDYSQNKKISFDSNGVKRICLIDNVGNINETTFEINHIDNEKMSCSFKTQDNAIVGNNVNGVQWYKSDINLQLIADRVGISGVMLGMNNQEKETYQTSNYIFDKDKANISNIYNTNTKAFTEYGFIKNQAGTKGKCNITFGVEKSIEEPVLSNAVSSYDTITAYYTSGSAISGIKNTTCYLTDSNGNIYKSVDPKGNNCIFKVDPSKVNTTYYFKKCIESNAGNSICSRVSSKENVGYCTSENYNVSTSRISNSEGSCSKSCGTGSRSYRYKEVYTSKYQGRSCGTSDEKTAYENCNTQDCCSWKKYSGDSGCSVGEGNCPTACGSPASTIYGNKTVYYVSGYDQSISCGSSVTSCSVSCGAKPSCKTPVTLNRITAGGACFDSSCSGCRDSVCSSMGISTGNASYWGNIGFVLFYTNTTYTIRQGQTLTLVYSYNNSRSSAYGQAIEVGVINTNNKLENADNNWTVNDHCSISYNSNGGTDYNSSVGNCTVDHADGGNTNEGTKTLTVNSISAGNYYIYVRTRMAANSSAETNYAGTKNFKIREIYIS